MKRDAIILYPCSAVGHYLSMVELGKLLAASRPSLSVHLLIFDQGYAGGGGGSDLKYFPAVSSAANITFHYITTKLPPYFSTPSPHIDVLIFAAHRHFNPEVRRTLTSISNHHNILGLVADFLCSAVNSVAEELSIPCYYYFAAGTGILDFLLHLPTIHDKYSDETYKDPATVLNVPGVPPLPVTDLLAAVRDRTDYAYEEYLKTSNCLANSAGIIVNSFERLEETAIQAVTSGQCVPDGPTPPVYCVGPLVTDQKIVNSSTESLKWLDSQPSESVVFLTFGSMGVFSAAQLKEMAVGLERSGQRFLWVIRNPSTNTNMKTLATLLNHDLDLESLLPEGFLERTKERGLVVKNWVPQVAVLNHGSVGGFVTHCGWNSVLEAVSAGVPLIGWPLYAEQRQNRLQIVDEMKIALPMNRSDNGLVTSVEVENRVKELMNSDEGECIRKRIRAMKVEAMDALSPGGSSLVALTRFIDSINLSFVSD